MNESMRQSNLPRSRPQSSRSHLISLLLALSGWIVFGIVAARAPTPARVLAVFAFTLICPGAALVRLLPVRDLLERAVLCVAIGLSLAALAAQTAATGHPPQALLVVAALALVCTLAAAVAETTQGEEAR